MMIGRPGRACKRCPWAGRARGSREPQEKRQGRPDPYRPPLFQEVALEAKTSECDPGPESSYVLLIIIAPRGYPAH